MAERGWKPVSANFLQSNGVATHWPAYEAGCINAGLPALRADWRSLVELIVDALGWRDLVDLTQLRAVFHDLEGRGRKRCTLMRDILEARGVDHHPGDGDEGSGNRRLTQPVTSTRGSPARSHSRVHSRVLRCVCVL